MTQGDLETRHDHVVPTGRVSLPACDALLEAICGVAYLTDIEGTIIAIGRKGWRAFAQDSGAGAMPVDAVLGRSVFAFISGDSVKASYRMLHDALATNTKRTISFPFRCDAPEMRREMHMFLSAVDGEASAPLILYQSHQVRSELRPEISLFDPRRRDTYDGELRDRPVVLCSYCQRVAWPVAAETAVADWIEPEDYYARGGRSDVRVSHGVCPECHDRLIAETA